MNSNPVIVGIAQGAVVAKPRELVSYALGSCVGVCLYDRNSNIAGMAHILLPSYKDARDQTNPYKLRKFPHLPQRQKTRFLHD